MPVATQSPLRVALFTDTFYEANGVGTVSRQLAQYAQENDIPLLVVRGSQQNRQSREGSVETLELKRGFASFRLDKGLYFDPLMTRHKQTVLERLREFRPDLVHITGPGDLGFLGVWVSHILRVSLVASWHTNLHEYLSRRLEQFLKLLPPGARQAAATALERHSLRGLLRFYRMPHFVLAPNQTMVDLLHTRTGRPAFLMLHGVDLSGYRPKACAREDDGSFCIGYVGRLTTEKNVRYFLELDAKLREAGEHRFRFLLVGEGGQQKWLRRNLGNAELPGVLRGADLAAAYQQMDVFVFPSRTDTFGLVILEAMASGVPAIVTPEAGQRIGLQDEVSGLLSDDFPKSVRRLMHNHELRQRLSSGARHCADQHGWRAVFDGLFETYTQGLATEDKRRMEREARLLRR